MQPPRRRSRSPEAAAAVRARLAGLEPELVRASRGRRPGEPTATGADGLGSDGALSDGALSDGAVSDEAVSAAARWDDAARDGDAGRLSDPEDGGLPFAASERAEPAGRGRSFRVDPGAPGLVLLCVVAVLAAALSAGATWLSRPSVEPVPEAPIVVAAANPSSTTTAASSAPDIVVAVVGQVVSPGLVTLAAGSRVADAVAAAGGALPEADLATVNLARVLTDGEQVALGVPGAVDPGAVPPGTAESGPVNLNTASEVELEELPGVGPVLAERIVTWRSDNGGFSSVDQLQEVDGIGPATFDELRDEVTV